MSEWMNEWMNAMLLKGTLNSLFYKQITSKKSPPKKNSSNGHANYPLCFNYADKIILTKGLSFLKLNYGRKNKIADLCWWCYFHFE